MFKVDYDEDNSMLLMTAILILVIALVYAALVYSQYEVKPMIYYVQYWIKKIGGI